MGFFDAFKTPQSVLRVRDEAQAWVNIVVAAGRADGESAAIETTYMSLYFSNSDVFGVGVDPADLYAESVQNWQSFGSKALIDASASYISQDSKDTLFTICADIMLSDGMVTQEEKEILKYTADTFGITDGLATKIIEVLIIKNKRTHKHA